VAGRAVIGAGDPGLRLTKTLQAIVIAILPTYPQLDAGARVLVEHDVARYVARQITAMPSFLRVPYGFAMLAFDWLALLRYGRPFRSLKPERGARYVAWWNDSPVSFMRDFVRLIRSSALLVYFDHPAVAQQLAAPMSLPPRREAHG
jgi:hypothetical protein